MTTKQKINIKPLANRVLVKHQEPEDTLKGGIILPDSAKKRPETAVVLAVGPGAKDKEGKLVPVEVKKGDVVLLDKYAGQQIELNGEEYQIIKSEDIIAIVE